jgi:16S rRNA processing protein RimM
VEGAVAELLAEGAELTVAGELRRVVRRAGTDQRPLLRLDGVDGRDLRGEVLWAPGTEPVEGEWGFDELVGCDVPGIGVVRRVIAAPSCEVLEVGDDAVLVPLVSDAVRRVDTAARVIEVDLRFLGLAE